MTVDKPLAAELGWTRRSTSYPFSSPVQRIRSDRVTLPAGEEREISYLENPGALYVVPRLSDGRLALICQYRYAVDEWVLELPAGSLSDHAGSPAELAAQELREEIGARAEGFTDVGWFYDAVPVSSSRCHVVVAFGVELCWPPDPGPAEQISPRLVTVERALAMAQGGEMRDGRSALALLRSAPLLV